VPEYLDPLDGLGWRSAVIDYALPASPRRAAQLRRLSGWSAPSWQDHFAAVETLIAEARSIGQYETESPPVPAPGARREPRFSARQTADMR
jgi:hypothetical protein